MSVATTFTYFIVIKANPSRWYNDETGRWESEDPFLAFADTWPEAKETALRLASELGTVTKVESHTEELCHHGMAAWLCEDPINHYPSDRSY